jgi:hypothetical protein
MSNSIRSNFGNSDCNDFDITLLVTKRRRFVS